MMFLQNFCEGGFATVNCNVDSPFVSIHVYGDRDTVRISTSILYEYVAIQVQVQINL